MRDVCRVELVAGDPENAVNILAKRGLELEDIVYRDALTLCFRIPAADLKLLEPLADSRGWQVRKLSQAGIRPVLRRLMKRKLLLLGLLGYCVLSLWLPTRVLFFHVEGNEKLPSAQILEAAEGYGLFFGASRREIRSERIKNGLLLALPELSWVGVNTRGCVASISVRERSPRTTVEEPQITGVYAVRDSVVQTVTVQRGTAQVAPGDAVRAGQLLISGYTDCGRFLRVQGARGEIFGETLRQCSLIAPMNRMARTGIEKSAWKITVSMGKKRINLMKSSGFSDSTCGKIKKEFWLTLPGGFRLPVCMTVERLTRYAVRAESKTNLIEDNLWKNQIRHYLLAQMISGEILRAEESAEEIPGGVRMTGSYRCREMIGRERLQEIEEIHGKSNGTDCQR